MASYIQIGPRDAQGNIIDKSASWRATVSKGGPRISQTFLKKKDAVEWATDLEATRAKGIIGPNGKTGVLLADAVEKYFGEFPDLSVSVKSPLNQLVTRYPGKQLSNLTSQDLVAHITEKAFSPASGAFHMSQIKKFLEYAEVAWKYRVPNILGDTYKTLKMKKLTGSSHERDRRLVGDEEKRLSDYLLVRYADSKIPMYDLFMFAIYSPRRVSELCRIRHTLTDLKKRTTIITNAKHPTKKIGNDQIIPLLPEAVEIIERQPRPFDGPRFNGDMTWDRVFPFKEKTISEYFTKAVAALGIEDLVWHDLRHEGISRLFERDYPIQEVARFSGHRDWKQLKRYTQIRAENIPYRPVKTKNAALNALLEKLQKNPNPDLIAELLKQAENQTA